MTSKTKFLNKEEKKKVLEQKIKRVENQRFETEVNKEINELLGVSDEKLQNMDTMIQNQSKTIEVIQSILDKFKTEE